VGCNLVILDAGKMLDDALPGVVPHVDPLGEVEHEREMTNVIFELCGFSELEKPNADIATRMTANLFFPNGDYPPLRSDVIRIRRDPNASAPHYHAYERPLN
jgi:hypothetical protein